MSTKVLLEISAWPVVGFLVVLFIAGAIDIVLFIAEAIDSIVDLSLKMAGL